MSGAIKYSQARFLISAASLQQLPPDIGAEVAFVGRSNAGKSSALNVLTQQKSLARVSKTPGRTRLINVFTLDANRRLIDLPGYGYAKVALQIKEEWQKLLSSYLKSRSCLKGVVLLMDIRHPLTEFDKNMIEWAIRFKLAVHILLTKADKLSRSQILQTTAQVEKNLANYEGKLSLQVFSALNKTGLSGLEQTLNIWLE